MWTLWIVFISDDASVALLQESASELATQVAQHLFDRDQTFLVGDAPTLADLVVAIALASSPAASHVPQQTHRHIQTILHRLMDVLRSSSNGALAKQLQVLVDGVVEGEPTPLQKEVVTAPAPTEPAPVVAAVAPAPSLAETYAPTKDATVAVESSSSTTEPAAATTTATSLPTVTAADIDDGSNPILALLTAHHIPHEVYSHPLCHTAEELVRNVPLPPTESHTKNLFLRDKKHGSFLITVSPNAAVNTKELGQKLQLVGKTNLRLADETALLQVLKAKPGCVGPLCVALSEGDDRPTLALDRALLSCTTIHFHPLRNDRSVKVTPDAFLQALKALGVEPVLLDFATTVTADAAPDGADATFGGKAPANRPPASKQPPAPKPKKTEAAASDATKDKNKKSTKKGETLLSLQWKKTENFPMWYSDVIVLSEMISYYDISGCYILRPWSYKIWEIIQRWFDVEIQKDGVENSYFPLFVSQERLEKEKDHVEGFAPEVAWVTKSGDGDLAKPIAIRPTSETIMYPAFSDWIQSHRDLPLKLNQWSNVVRWEFKYPTPFLRTREFLWQEGHTAHATFEEADEMVMRALEWYRRVYEELLAVPVVPGYKTEKEKFAGGFRTTTVEAYVAGSGRAIQGATSHNLGQNFGKMFHINFQDDKGQTEFAWQTSWGLTTRTIGVMVMVHGDDQGLVIPPRVAPLQVVLVAVVSKKFASEVADPYCRAILDDLQRVGIRAKFDDRDSYNAGWKYNHWEQKGVPVRLEVGPKDYENKAVRLVVRHDGSKEDVPVEGLAAYIQKKLEEIQEAMFVKAKEARDSHVVEVTEWKDFVPNLEKHNLVLTPWCGGEHEEWEEWVKKTSREESLKALGEDVEDEKTATSVAAKTLCIPFNQPVLPPGTKCIASGLDATCWVLWGRSY